MQESEEIARLFLEMARAEVNLRAQLRDGVLLAFLAAAAALFAFALAKESDPDAKKVLLVIPHLAFGAALLLTQHNLLIHVLSRYQIDELAKFLGDGSRPLLWESSMSLHSWRPYLLALTLFGPLALLVAPSVLALALAPRDGSTTVLWGRRTGWLVVLLTAALLGSVFVVRVRGGHSPQEAGRPSDARLAPPNNALNLTSGAG